MALRSLRRGLRLALVTLAMACASAAAARPFSIDDLLSLERFDQAEITPDGRRLVLQVEAAYDTAARFDFDQFSAPLLGRIKVADLASGGPARDLLTPALGTGYLAGPLSPDGYKIVVQRLKGDVWDTGVVDLATGEARWFGVPTETAVWGRSLQWRSKTRLVGLALAAGQFPERLRTLHQTTRRLAALWRAAADGRQATTSLVGSGRDLGLWPDAPAVRLVEIDTETGAVRDLARGAFIDLELSPDGRYAAVLANAEAEQPAAGEAVRVSTPGRRRTLTLVDLETGAVTAPLPDRDLLSHLLDWSPAGDRLLVFGRRIGADWTEGDLLDVRAVDGHVSAPARGRVAPALAYLGAGLGIVRAAWLGDTPLLLGHRSGGAVGRDDSFRLTPSAAINLTGALPAGPPRLLSLDPAGVDVIAGDGLYRLDGLGRARRRLVDARLGALDLPRLGEGDRFDLTPPPRSGAAWVTTTSGLRRVTAAALGAPLPLRTDETAIAVGDGEIALRARDARGVTTVAVRTRQAEVIVATINARLTAVDPTPIVPIHHAGPDGRPLTSWLYLPTAGPAGRRPPLIVLPYPGAAYAAPPGRYAPDALVFTPNARLLSAHGYAVLAPSLPREQAAGEPAQGLAPQMLAAVDAVVARRLADPDRMALWGHSFGGYGALVAAAQTDRFKAIVAQAAKSDLAAGWGTISPFYRANPEEGPMFNGDIGWSETGQGGLGVPPWRDPDRYRRNSPFFLADHVKTPVFLIQGDQDFVALAQAEAMFATLYRQGRDARLMTLFGEGHVIGSPANVRAIYAEVLPWLDRELGSPLKDQQTPADRAPAPSAGPRSP